MSKFYQRQGQMVLYEPYFYTETIYNYKTLLADDNLKLIIIKSLQYLTSHKFITIFGYVIMPNHIHLLWNIMNMNGKEIPSVSFSKYTAHEFEKYLKNTDLIKLASFESNKRDRKYHFWKRDPLAIHISSELIFDQRLEYIHNNPLQEKWKICKTPEDYRWSSARFYIDGYDEFSILTNYYDC